MTAPVSTTMILSYLFFLWAVCVSAQQLYLFNITTPVDGLSSTCIQVLNQAIACDPVLLRMEDGDVQSDETIASVCGTTCTSAWTNYLRRVDGACGTSRFDGGNGLLYLPRYDIEPIYERFQSLCLKNSAAKYCNAVIRDVLGIDPVGQTRSSGLPPLPTSAACDGCFLSSLAQILGMPYSSAPVYSTALSKLQEACKTTVALPGCQGTSYTIQSSDTCQSIAMAQGFSTTQLLEANKLTAYCRDFPKAGSTICIPDKLKCKPYAPRLGDTCNSIAAANEVSFAQIVSWNPEVGSSCGNMEKVANKTMVICVSAPGGAWVDPGPSVTTKSTSRTNTIFTMTGTDFSLLPSATAGSALDCEDGAYVAPLANGTRQDCQVYVTPPVLMNATGSAYDSYDCEDVASLYGVAMADLLAWNPGLNTTGGTFSECEMPGTRQFCVQPLVRNATDIAANCSMTAVAFPTMSNCRDFAALYNITTAALAAWNPTIKDAASCSGYHVGTSYCVAASHFRSPNTVSNCAYWAAADRANPSLCSAFETKYKLEHARFVAWNPWLLSDCTGAVRGYDLCVGIPTFHPGFP